MVKEILCALLEHGYTQCTYSPHEIMHWQFMIQLIKDMLIKAWQQPWGIVPVPDLVDSPLCLVDQHFIEAIPGQKGSRRKHPSHTCLTCNVSKEALSDTGLGDSYKPKKFTSHLCSICKGALCIDPCFRLCHTEKDYTSEIIKIARMSVKPIQKDAQHVRKYVQHIYLVFSLKQNNILCC